MFEAAKDSKLIIWDGMFTDDELKMRKGWGHSSIEQGSNFLDKSGASTLAICHHSPYREDQEMLQLEMKLTDNNIFLAREGQSFKI